MALSPEAKQYWEKQRQIQQDRKTKRVKCEYCGHRDTKAELEARLYRMVGRRQLRRPVNDEPRRFCSQACQKAAWEKEHGAERKRRYRAAQRCPDGNKRATEHRDKYPSHGETPSGHQAVTKKFRFEVGDRVKILTMGRWFVKGVSDPKTHKPCHEGVVTFLPERKHGHYGIRMDWEGKHIQVEEKDLATAVADSASGQGSGPP